MGLCLQKNAYAAAIISFSYVLIIRKSRNKTISSCHAFLCKSQYLFVQKYYKAEKLTSILQFKQAVDLITSFNHFPVLRM